MLYLLRLTFPGYSGSYPRTAGILVLYRMDLSAITLILLHGLLPNQAKSNFFRLGSMQKVPKII